MDSTRPITTPGVIRPVGAVSRDQDGWPPAAESGESARQSRLPAAELAERLAIELRHDPSTRLTHG